MSSYTVLAEFCSSHNDLPWRFRKYANDKVYSVDMRGNLADVWTDPANPSQTDIPRLRRGKLGGQVHVFNIIYFVA